MADGLALRNGCVGIIGALELPNEGGDRIIQSLRCREIADVFHFGEDYINILDGVFELFDCVAGSLSTVPVELEQADAVFTPCGVTGRRIESRFSNGVRQCSSLVNDTELAKAGNDQSGNVRS